MSSALLAVNQKTFDRFINKIYFTDHCWLWTASISPDGYGRFRLKDNMAYAHRVSYEWFIDSIPKGLTVDHQCLMKHCVNPDHLSIMAGIENIRKHYGSSTAECSSGHSRLIYGARNIYGYSICKECRYLRNKKYYSQYAN